MTVVFTISFFTGIINDPEQIQVLGNLFGHATTHELDRMEQLTASSYLFLRDGMPLRGPDMALIAGLCSFPMDALHPHLEIVEGCGDLSKMYAPHGTRSTTGPDAWAHATQVASTPELIRSYWAEGSPFEGSSLDDITRVLCKQFFTMVG